VVCRSFVEGREHRLQPLNDTTLHLPYATSLRMGRLGYQSDAQSSLGVSYNCLQSYAQSLRGALTQPYPPYEAIGIRRGDEYLQLNTDPAADRERVLRHDPPQTADTPR
jgi:glutamate--cysteine ligase